MLQRYREIFYGLLLGLGAWIIDVVMHSQTEGGGFWAELIRLEGATLFYRLLFVAFGFALGWSLWQKSKRERDFRQLAEILNRFHREIGEPAFLIHAKLEVLLTREDFHLAPGAEEIIRFVYDKSQRIVSLSKERVPIETET